MHHPAVAICMAAYRIELLLSRYSQVKDVTPTKTGPFACVCCKSCWPPFWLNLQFHWLVCATSIAAIVPKCESSLPNMPHEGRDDFL